MSHDLTARILLAWAGSILVPLMLVPQKQEHYLLPLMPPLMLMAGWMVHHAVEVYDSHRMRIAIMAGTVAAAVLMVFGVGIWLRRLEPVAISSVASEIRSVAGGRPVAFYPIEHAPLIFELRQVVPVYQSEAELAKAVHDRPDLLVICEVASDQKLRPPAPMRPIRSIQMRKKSFIVFQQP